MTKLCNPFHVRKSRATPSRAEQVGRCRRSRLRPCPSRPRAGWTPQSSRTARALRMHRPPLGSHPPPRFVPRRFRPTDRATPPHRSTIAQTPQARIETHPASPRYPPFTPASPAPRISLRRADRFAWHFRASRPPGLRSRSAGCIDGPPCCIS